MRIVRKRQSLLLFGSLLLATQVAGQAQFAYVTNNGTITITGYTDTNAALAIPVTINGLPVTSVGDYAFAWAQSLTSVTIPDSVSHIGTYGFYNCNYLTDVTLGNGVKTIGSDAFDTCVSLRSIVIPNSVTSIDNSAFFDCTSLTNVWIGNSVTSVGGGSFAACSSLTAIKVDPNNPAYGDLDGDLFDKTQTTLVQCPAGRSGNYSVHEGTRSIGFAAFEYCNNLSSILIPASVTVVGDGAFFGCSRLTAVYFLGNAPIPGSNVFFSAPNATVYYLAATSGWGPTFAGVPTALWQPQMWTAGASFGSQTNQFGFNVTWASGMVLVVEASTDLAGSVWTPVAPNTLIGGSFYFSDPQWTNFPGRFYRVRSQ